MGFLCSDCGCGQLGGGWALCWRFDGGGVQFFFFFFLGYGLWVAGSCL